MAVPSLTATYPANNDTGIPIGESLELLFDRGVDLLTVKNSVVLYGQDFDTRSGPDQVIWANDSNLSNPNYLKSPGFKGVVDLDFTLVYWDLVNDVALDPGVVTAEADETSAGVGHKVIATPTAQLAAGTTYKLAIMGDPDGIDTGISARTVFDIEADGGNSGTTGEIYTEGTYNGSTADTVVIEITTSGNIGTAEYKWYYSSLGSGSATLGRITARRFRRLENGLQVRFAGSGFVSGDIYTFNVEPIQRLATNTQVSFTTNDGTFTAAPDSPSTPATAEPGAGDLPSSISDVAEYLYVEEMFPGHTSYNVAKSTNQIVLTFSEPVDASTITDDSITLKRVSASGQYSDTGAPVEMAKTLTVSGNQVVIDF